MKRLLILATLFIAASALASQSPSKKPQTVTLQQRMEQLEKQMATMASSHDKTMARMKQLEDQLDKLISVIRGFRENLKGK